MVDTGLIVRCQQREPEAFDVLFKTYATKALRTTYLLVNRRDLAEDIIQEAFLQCYHDILQLRSPELFEVWFHRILVRICWRMASRERKFPQQSLGETIVDFENDQNPMEAVEKTQEAHIIWQAINQLSIPMRTTMILYYYNDMSVKEISQVMQCFQGTVKSRLHNGRKILAKELKNQLYDISQQIMPELAGKGVCS